MPEHPRLAVSTGPLWRLSVDEVFAAAKAVGADGVEILVSQDRETQSPEPLEKLANRHDLPIVAIHAPLLLLTRRVYTSDPLEKIRRTIELSRALDVGVIVLHPPYLWQVKYSLWLLHELEEAAGDHTLVTMENMYPTHVGGRTLAFHRFLSLDSLRRFDHLTLDTSHLAVAGEDIVDAYRRLADKVAHIHLSDNRGKGRDSHAPLGEGILPIADFCRSLDGPALRSICLEINAGPAATDRGRLEQVLGASLETVRSNLPAPSTEPPGPAAT
ncbi:MAG TPA: sugar phosphate isomerase/epimerase [Actinomycetota bacterium]|nr:sugar phosphate isomerase/epimerase [Actinomycetota bacterium]